MRNEFNALIGEINVPMMVPSLKFPRVLLLDQ